MRDVARTHQNCKCSWVSGLEEAWIGLLWSQLSLWKALHSSPSVSHSCLQGAVHEKIPHKWNRNWSSTDIFLEVHLCYWCSLFWNKLYVNGKYVTFISSDFKLSGRPDYVSGLEVDYTASSQIKEYMNIKNVFELYCSLNYSVSLYSMLFSWSLSQNTPV